MNKYLIKKARIATLLLSAPICANFAIASPASAVNLVRNGSFETGNFADWTKSGNINIRPLPSEGKWSTAFSFGNLPNTGVLFQDLETEVGQRYELSFDFGVNGDPIDQFLQVELIGSSVLLDETLSDRGPLDYSLFKFNFLADATTTRLKFSDVSTATYRVDIRLDNVVVETIPEAETEKEAVPEPSSILGLFALGGLGVRSLLKRKSQ